MKFEFLPEEIKAEIDDNLIGSEPLALARTNMAIGGLMGESFIIAYDEKFYFFTKAMGSNVYTKIEGLYTDISGMTVHKDHKNAVIEFQIGRKKYLFKFSHLEERNLNKVMARWLSDNISPFIAFLSVLMNLAYEDDTLADAENDFIVKVASANEEVLEAAHAIYQSMPLNTLTAILAKCSEEQKYCIVANMLELAMADGILHSDELKFIRHFAEGMGLETEEYHTIKQVMVLKNRIGLLKQNNNNGENTNTQAAPPAPAPAPAQ